MIRPNQQYQPFCITVRLRALCRNICPAVRGSTSRKCNSWGSSQWRRRWLQESDGTAVGSDHSVPIKQKCFKKQEFASYSLPVAPQLLEMQSHV